MKKLLITIVVVAAGAFTWWTISPLFIDKEVNDELDPEIAALLDQAETTTIPSDTSDPREGVTPIPEDERQQILIEVDDPDDREPAVTSGLAPSQPAQETSTPTPGATPGPVVSGPFNIEDTRGHPASGSVRTIQTADQSVVRFENYDGTNGPDLFVYLANDLDATEFVNLGRAKGNMGNINYEVPSDIDLDDYKYVMTWCKAFGVLFDYAEIN